ITHTSAKLKPPSRSAELWRFHTCERIGLAAYAPVHVNALRRAGTQPPAMAPLPLLAQHWLTTNCDTAETCCARLLALGAPRGALPMPLRLSQSNRHTDCEQHYSESPQHGFFLPRLSVETLCQPTWPVYEQFGGRAA